MAFASPILMRSGAAASSFIRLLPEVAVALASGRPVVALESTIVAHGMPYPQNLEVAKDVCSILRSKGVTPATIAVKDGLFRVGLHVEELEDLSLAGGEGRATKCSSRDLPLLAAKHYRAASSVIENGDPVLWGATTVAATMRLAHIAGISTFVTGGTGGVHRGGEFSLDVSTDLFELSRTPTVVVSAGVKSILDVKRTLEVLETYGVPTGVWKSDDFPAFFSPKSGLAAPLRFDGPVDVARTFWAGQQLGMPTGILVAVPNHDPAGETVDAAIQEALKEAEHAGIQGKDVTPFILRAVAEKTGGESLRSNIALVKNNAYVGADIALAIADMAPRNNQGSDLVPEKEVVGVKLDTVLTNYKKTVQVPGKEVAELNTGNDVAEIKAPIRPRVICVGASIIDVVAKSSPEKEFILRTSNPGTSSQSDGGVCRNIAEVLGRLGSQPLFYTAVGKQSGSEIVGRLRDCGVVTTEDSVLFIDGVNTAQYIAIHDHTGDLVCGVVDMQTLSMIPVPSAKDLVGTEFLVLDANLPEEKLAEVAKNATKAGVRVCFEPTSVPKARHMGKHREFLSCLSYAFPNEDELFAMAEAHTVACDNSERSDDLDNEFQALKSAAKIMLFQMNKDSAHIITTLGSRGVLLASKTSPTSGPNYTIFPAEILPNVGGSNGAGDTLCGAFIHALLVGKDMPTSVHFSMKAAAMTLLCRDRAVSPHLSSIDLSDVDS